MINNVTKGWKTTVVGLVILGAAVASVFLTSSVNWFDASIGIGIGLALVFAPDTIISRVSDLFKRDESPLNHVPDAPPAPQNPQLPE